MTIQKPSPKKSIEIAAIATATTIFCIFQAVGVGLPIIERIIASIALIWFARYYKIVAIAIFIVFVVPLFYLPAGFEYGAPTSGYIAAVFETNPNETAEFLSILPIRNFFYPAALLAVLAYALFWRRLYPPPPPPNGQVSGHAKTAALIVIIITLFFSSIPYRFYRAIYKSYVAYADLIAKAEATPIKKYEIIKRADAANKDIRIVVIGESVRKDYLSVYGYPHQTTPFLDNANGVFIDKMIAAGPSTMASLSRMLTAKENGQIDWSRTIVTLGSQIGYETYWISNSGFAGKTATAVSLIASRSDRSIFLNTAGSVNSGAVDDFAALGKFDEILQTPAQTPKLVFIHMAGSHSEACNRLYGFPNRFNLPYGEEHNCYLATIDKLDSFIKALIDQTKRQKLSWSLIYFSDHGQEHYGDKKQIGLRHGGRAKQSYEVPLFLLDDNATEHIVIKRQISGLHLIDLVASWLGAETDRTDSRYTFTDFLEDSAIDTSNGAFDNLKDDPALY
ncbi:MAG: phosphoethanolamine transferase [Helicobacteraceae bacterium]|jgi:glucan phosphoethanolaminetransferase (alkaline phosphatase superfamily)|nr:phosphoethanolamine transferase [Helicobacteraceae bacterium]